MVFEILYLENLTMKEAKEEAQKRGMDILTCNELDGLIKQKILNPNLILWSGTNLKYDGTDGEITENGKTIKCKVPEKNGWYETNEFGIPLGKPSTSSNPEARYLWRRPKNDSLLVRWGYYKFFGGRRGVDADGDGDCVCGVLLIKRK